MKKTGAINRIWFFLLMSGCVYGVLTKNAQAVSDAAVKYAGEAVKLCIGLSGTMSLWMGIMKIADESGLISKLSKLLGPVLKLLFPDVPEGHPAFGAMSMNIAANMLGLGNAATPFGIKAIGELNSINEKKGTASHSMIMFLAINTVSVTLIPANVTAMRSACGSDFPSAVTAPTLLSSLTATVFAAALCLIMRKVSKGR